MTPRAPAAAPVRATTGLERDTLAWVDGRGITALDLVQRIEWMPWPEKRGAAAMDSAKVRALESLVAEALLAAESRRAAPADDSLPHYAGLRRALLRDALYRTAAGGTPERAAPFLVQQLSGRHVEVDSATFVRLADSLGAYLRALDEAPLPDGGYRLPPEVPDVMAQRLAPWLGATIARLPDGPVTLGAALEDMRFYPFTVRTLRPDVFAIELNTPMRRIVEGELLAREASRRGLARRADVRRELRRWADAWRAESASRELAAGVVASDDDAFRTLALRDPEHARQACEIDVSEILCSSRGQAEAFRGELAHGARFDSLATRRSRRSEWAANGGRSGWIAASAHPELGFAALLAPIDSLVGPVELPEGQSLFRVHGKRLADSTQSAGLLAEARALSSGEQRQRAIATHVAGLANRAAIRMRYPALKRVEILPSNMVVKRTLGFGGGMMASPSLLPMWTWTREWSGRGVALP